MGMLIGFRRRKSAATAAAGAKSFDSAPFSPPAPRSLRQRLLLHATPAADRQAGISRARGRQRYFAPYQRSRRRQKIAAAATHFSMLHDAPSIFGEVFSPPCSANRAYRASHGEVAVMIDLSSAPYQMSASSSRHRASTPFSAMMLAISACRRFATCQAGRRAATQFLRPGRALRHFSPGA